MRSFAQLGRIGPLLSEIRKEEAQTTHRQSQKAEWAAGRRKKLGKLRYETKQPQVLQAEALPKNLRTLPAADSLMQDRFDSLQERNMIEVRQRAKAPRRAKRSTVSRRTQTHPPCALVAPRVRGWENGARACLCACAGAAREPQGHDVQEPLHKGFAEARVDVTAALQQSVCEELLCA